MEERWEIIKGFEDYEISNKGSVRRLYLKGYKTRAKVIQNGYVSVTFSKGNTFKKFQVHRLVAIAFIPNPDNKPCINHIDGNKLNNEDWNLEWNTFSENELHSHRILGKKTNGIIRRKINLDDFCVIKALYYSGFSQTTISEKYNVNQATISNIINGKTYVKYV